MLLLWLEWSRELRAGGWLGAGVPSTSNAARKQAFSADVHHVPVTVGSYPAQAAAAHRVKPNRAWTVSRRQAKFPY